MTSPTSRRSDSGLGRARRGRVAILGALLLAAACEDPVTPDDQPFGWVGDVRIEVVSPVAEGAGELRHVLEWASTGEWRSLERISYRGRLGDETVARSAGDLAALARSYAAWVELVNDTPSVTLFTERVDAGLDPACVAPNSTVHLRIADRIRGDSIAWTRCSQSGLSELTGEGAGPDANASRVTQAVALARNFTLAQQRGYRYQYPGSVPFATLARGQSAIPLTVPRVIEDAAAWRSFWAEVNGTSTPAPTVDFATDVVLVGAVGTRHEAGDSVEIRGVLPVRGGTQVALWEQRAGHFCTPAPRTHVPFHIVVAPVIPRPIFFSDVSLDTVPCG